MKLCSFISLIVASSTLYSSILYAQDSAQSSTPTSAEMVLDASDKIQSMDQDHSSSADSLKRLLQALKTYRAQFNQVVVDGQGELIQESVGHLILKQPNLMLWNVIEPDENSLIADGETLWYIDPFVEQVTAVQQAQSVANNPVVLLTDPDNESWQDFNIRFIDNEYIIEAIKPESHISLLVLRFDETGMLSRLRFTDRQQQNSELVFTDIQQNHAVSNDIFSFSLPEGFEMDDQR